MLRNTSIRSLAALVSVALCLGSYSSMLRADSPPQMSADGLKLRSSTDSSVVYVKPGANFGKYDKVAILDCFVEFDQNWQSNYNSQQVDPSTYVSTDDMNRIKKELAAEFKKVFIQELTAKGAYSIVDYGAADVLVLRPAIINLRVTQPDLMTPGMSMTLIRSAGSMTGYVELYDSVSNTLLARAISSKADQGGGQVASSVSNAMAADFILKRWADALRNGLEAARSKPSG
jgi:hypothetical protein